MSSSGDDFNVVGCAVRRKSKILREWPAKDKARTRSSRRMLESVGVIQVLKENSAGE